MMTKINKAVFPVAGLGTRFLPATKAYPKEMLPIIDKPLIHYAVEEAIGAGIRQLIFVTSSGKRAIEDYFDTHYELEARLAARQKTELLSLVKNIIPPHVSCIYVRQASPLGLGHAILCAESVVGDEPFAVLLADDVIEPYEPSCLSSMIHLFEQSKQSVIAVEEVPDSAIERYGIVSLSDDQTDRIVGMVEKPKVSEAPSNLAAVGRYVLSPRIFELLKTTEQGCQEELQLTDALAQLLEHESVHAYRLQGKRYDCGDRFGYLCATLEFARRHPTWGPALQKIFDEKVR